MDFNFTFILLEIIYYFNNEIEKRHMKVMSDWGGATWPNLRLAELSPLAMLFIKKACMLTQSNILARFIRTINECY